MAYDKTNTGTIAKNTRKTQDNHPDITGSINIDGREYYLNGWQRTNSKDNSTFYSLSVKPKQPRQDAAPARQNSPPADFSDLDTDPIPF